MPSATYVQSSFTGGEISKTAQGRYHDPKYRTALNVCLNGLPVEDESWRRRPGFSFAGTTRSGAPGRVVKFDFQQQAPYTMEFTDSHLRFWSGLSLVGTNDDATVIAISTANPAVVQFSAAVTWATNDQAFFIGDGTPTLLQNRVFTLTKSDTTHFSLADAVTGTAIDGSTLNALGATCTMRRALDIATPYVGGQWQGLRSVQTETTAFLLHGDTQPYAVTVASEPTATAFGTFNFTQADFHDGPYLDPFTNGVLATPSAVSGTVTITLSFATWSATLAYAKGSFVTYSSVVYESILDDNVNHQPDISPTAWTAVSAQTAISPSGFVTTDIGRQLRFFSEPPLWVIGTVYSAGNVVSYVDNTGATAYYTCVTGHTASAILAPGISLDWAINGAAIVWTWGKITALLNNISGTLAGSTNIGLLTAGGGLTALFDGTLSKNAAAAASYTYPLLSLPAVAYAGKNYSGASAQKIYSATWYPANDKGYFQTLATILPFGLGADITAYCKGTFYIYASHSPPANATDGTIIGQDGPFANQVGALTILSTDTTTAWEYVWVTISVQFYGPGPTFISPQTAFYGGQLVFSNPVGTGTSGNGVTVSILGPPLLYTTAIRTWRIGVYSNTTGWPTCGTYSDGRIWLSGVVANRIDACVSNGIIGTNMNFAPTDQNGNVLASSGITYTFNAPDANPLFWMTPDLQGIICGTLAGEWLVTAPTTGGISPFNISARRVTQIGCANIEPRRTEHTTVFVQKFGRKIMEYFADVFSGKFTAPNLAWLAKHLTLGNIQELAYQQELVPTIWSRVAGALRGITYRRDTLMTSQGPTMVGWHKHTLGSGRSIEYMSVGPSVGGTVDALTVVTNDTTTNIRHVEILDDLLDEAATLAEASYLDDAVTATSFSDTGTGLLLNGLWHLNGKTVTAWLCGLDCGDYLVTNGSITVPYGDGISAGTGNGLFTHALVVSFGSSVPLRIGFTFTSRGQLVRPNSPAESGARDGPAFGKLRRNNYVMAQLEGTQGVSFGTTFDDLEPADFKQADNFTSLKVNEQFDGIFRDQIDDTDTFDGMICWEITRPYICNIAAIGSALETRDV
jgi:hypothetical protein